MDLVHKYILIGIWSIEGILAVILNLFGLYFLITHKKQKVTHILLIHLTCIDIVYICLEVIYHSIDLTVHPNTATRHWWKRIASLVLMIMQYQTVSLLTLDRVLAVKFCLRYGVVVTKRRAKYALVFIWLICACHTPYFILTNGWNGWWNGWRILVFWVILVLVFFIVAYLYIVIKVIKYKREFREITQQLTHPPFKYHVPLLIVISFLCTITLPEMFRQFEVLNYTWGACAEYLNYIFDPLVYTLGCPHIRYRIRCLWHKVKDAKDTPVNVPWADVYTLFPGLQAHAI